MINMSSRLMARILAFHVLVTFYSEGVADGWVSATFSRATRLCCHPVQSYYINYFGAVTPFPHPLNSIMTKGVLWTVLVCATVLPAFGAHKTIVTPQAATLVKFVTIASACIICGLCVY